MIRSSVILDLAFIQHLWLLKKVEVSSRAYGSDQGYTWVSEASDGYESLKQITYQQEQQLNFI